MRVMSKGLRQKTSPLPLVLMALLVLGFSDRVEASGLKYKCYSQHVFNPKALDSLRDTMIIEVDTSRPSITLYQDNYGLFTTKATYSPGKFRTGDGFTVKTTFRTVQSKIFFEYGVASISFDFKARELTFSPTIEFPMKCKPM